MNIRQATPKDLDGIWPIYQKVKLDYSKLGDNTYDAEIQRRGFLIGDESQEEILDQIKNSKFFLVAESNGQILGYLRANTETEYYDDEYKTWFDNGLKDTYYNSTKSLSILTLAVDTDQTHMGIGSALLKEIENTARNNGFEYIFTVITIAPLTNCPMISWRTKVGFKRLAMGKPREELFGLKWYASLLMYKEI